MGLDDPTIDEAGIGDPVPAPDPLKNSSAEVDQARAAETGARRGEPGEVDITDDALGQEAGAPYEDDFERAPDEAEEDLVHAGGGGRGGAGLDPAVAEGHPDRPRRNRGRFITFLGHCVDELRRVQWPDRPHVFQATAVVLGFCLIAGGWLGLMDAIWKPIVNAIL